MSSPRSSPLKSLFLILLIALFHFETEAFAVSHPAAETAVRLSGQLPAELKKNLNPAAKGADLCCSAVEPRLDRTDSSLNFCVKNLGLAPIDELSFQVGSQTFHLRLTAAAKKILLEKDFAVGGMALTDPTFTQDDFFAFIKSQFTSTVTAFNRDILKSDTKIKEVYLVLDDLKAATFSQAETFARIISLDVRKWHQIKIQPSKRYLGELSSYHEFTHVVNYFHDAGDDRLTRERMAVLGEEIRLQNLYNPMDAVTFKFYLNNMAAPLKRPVDSSFFTALKSDGRPDMDLVRRTIFTLSKGVKEGEYRFPDPPAEEPARIAAGVSVLQRCLADLLQDQVSGEASFDATFKKEGLKDASGADLTWAKLESDLMKTLPSVKSSGK
ncbi:MAG: hypothetical protein H7222_01080 [Methylotenera sp.]|nr:hypothetical protein [Oligoflexia bacterium]